MDYCAACRRHLNGALSCPGCGASGGVSAPPRPPVAEPWPGAHPPVPGPVPIAVPQEAPGRAARSAHGRRRPKPRQRALALTVAGLVIGGLGAAILSTGDSDGATTPSSSPDAGRSRPADEAATGPASALPSTGALGTSGPRPTGSAHPKPSPSPSAGSSGPSPAPSGKPSAGASASRPGTSDPSPAPPQPSPTQPRPTVTPTPTPSPTCKRVLFWCS